MKKILALLAVLTGVLALLLLGTTAQAKPTAPYAPAYETVTESATLGPISPNTTIKTTCPEGKSVTGGGFSTDRPPNEIVSLLVSSSYPDPDGRTWVIVLANNGQQGPIQVKAYAVCANTQ